MDKPWTDSRRMMAASQFFAQFGHLSPEALSKMLNNKVSASTIRRDRDNLKNSVAPSVASVTAYLALQNRPEELDLNDPDALVALMEETRQTRIGFFSRFRPDPYTAGERLAYPDFWPRALQRFDEGEWLSVIDIVEPQLTGAALKAFRNSKFSAIEPQLRHHLAIAHLQRGDIKNAIDHLRTGLALLWNTNSDARRDTRFHLATDLALNLMSLPSAMKSDDEVVNLVIHVIEDRLPHPKIVTNLLIIALSQDGKWSGYITGRLEAAIERSRDTLDFAVALTTILEDEELKSYHNHDMFKRIEASLRKYAP
ncbi:hypothetical protein [uncultured Tateyamaria sp.]|uniref:hypothetical protein n=1 Tax=uncultured Tateyamaria sp. TaxID=455651 RepID=UPI002618F631|nr:hypothetical protein [uncultured Tateyamaria sp.]